MAVLLVAKVCTSPNMQAVIPHFESYIFTAQVLRRTMMMRKGTTIQAIKYSSNRHDPCGDILATEARIEELGRDTVGEKRTYTKRDLQFVYMFTHTHHTPHTQLTSIINDISSE